MENFWEKIWTFLVAIFFIWAIYYNFIKPSTSSNNWNKTNSSYPLLDNCKKDMQEIINEYDSCKINLQDKNITYKWDYDLNNMSSMQSEILFLMMNCKNQNTQMERVPFYKNPRYLLRPVSVLKNCEWVKKEEAIKKEVINIYKLITEISLWRNLTNDEYLQDFNKNFSIINQVVNTYNDYWNITELKNYTSANNNIYDFVINK